MIIVVAFIVVFMSIAYHYARAKRWNLPPGPRGYPLVGNLIQLGRLPHVKLTEWSNVYGNIFQCWFGLARMVVLCDPKLIREAFNDPKLIGRVDHEAFTIFSDGPHGVINSSGQEWAEQRRFTLRHLRDFGFGKSAMEEFIMSEISEFLESLKATKGEPIDIGTKFTPVVLNSLWMILTGKRYRHDDKRLTYIFDKMKELSEKVTFSPGMMFPTLGKMFPKLTKYGDVIKIINEVREVVKGHINDHLINRPQDGVPRDFIDSYLNEIEATTDPKSSFYKETGMHSLVAVNCDMFIAGADTTSTMLVWLVLYLCKHPQVQENLQKELNTVVGKNRLVSLSDRPSLPYTEATIHEVCRIASNFPMGVFHVATEDAKLGGYDVPKGTWICPNFFRVHHSREIWGDPESFRPERFLSSDGKTVVKHEALMPFSVGKRACLAETLARDELFLFTTNLFQRFRIKLADDSVNVGFEPKPGIVISPPDFNVVLTDRSATED